MMSTKKRCCDESCKKKLTLTDEIVGKCNCGNTYCSTHKPSSEHKCTYNYVDASKKVLTSTLSKVVSAKVEIL
jgi:hypothetical protein